MIKQEQKPIDIYQTGLRGSPENPDALTVQLLFGDTTFELTILTPAEEEKLRQHNLDRTEAEQIDMRGIMIINPPLPSQEDLILSLQNKTYQELRPFLSLLEKDADE